MGDQMQSFYGKGRISKGDPGSSQRARRYGFLVTLGTLFGVLGWVVAVLGTILVFIQTAALSSAGAGEVALASALAGLVFVALVAVSYLAMGQLIQLLVDVQDNSHRTAVAVEDLDETLDEIQAFLESRGSSPPSTSSAP